MAYEYKQGFFHPKQPKKYRGDSSNIVYRSGWEKRVMEWCDSNKNVTSTVLTFNSYKCLSFILIASVLMTSLC